MAQAISSNARPGTRTGRSWSEWPGWDYVPGIAFIAIGVFALTQPPAASLAASIFFGALLCVAGAFAFVGGVANIGHRGGWLVALLGALSLCAGFFLLYYPIAGAITLIWTIGAWLVVGAGFELAIALSTRVGRGWLMFVALVDLALGVIILMMNPVQAFAFLGIYVGISLIARGLWSVVFVAGFHRVGEAADAVLA